MGGHDAELILDRRRPARRRHRRGAARRPDADPGPAALPRPRDARRLGGDRRDRVQRRRARPDAGHDRPRPDPLRGRPDRRLVGDPPGARHRGLAGDRRHRRRPPASAGLAAHWIFGLSVLEGMLVGAAIAATDSAAIFAVLRRSTLEKRLARSLEGESGMNDPVALLLVIGFIEWIQEPGFGLADMAGLLALKLAIGIAIGLAHRAARGRRARPRAAADRRHLPGGDDRDRRPRLRARRGRPRLRPARRLPDRAGARLGADPGPAHDRRLPRGGRLGRPDRPLHPARAARLPEHARRRRARRPGALGGPDPRRPPAGRLRRDRLHAAQHARAGDARLGRAARARRRSGSPPSRSSPASAPARSCSRSSSSSSSPRP